MSAIIGSKETLKGSVKRVPHVYRGGENGVCRARKGVVQKRTGLNRNHRMRMHRVYQVTLLGPIPSNLPQLISAIHVAASLHAKHPSTSTRLSSMAIKQRQASDERQ